MTDPNEDGITHINVYSQGRTRLGRWLSNFAREDVRLDGRTFASIEAYWYWLSTHDDRLCPLYGYTAKKVGRELRGEDWPVAPGFQDKILGALRAKARARPDMIEELRGSNLPLKHYYVFGGAVREPSDGQWMLDFWEGLRK